MVLFFCLTTLQNWQNCPAALTNHSGFLSIQLGFFRTSRGGANMQPVFAVGCGRSTKIKTPNFVPIGYGFGVFVLFHQLHTF